MSDLSSVDFATLPEPVLGAHPEWVELWRTAWTLAARNRRTGRDGRRYMDCAWDPARNYQWVWDSCFMALYCRYAPGHFPGMGSLDNFYERQRDDGYIGMTYDMDTGVEPWPNRINPPLFAWTEWEYYRTTGDASRLARVAGHIERLMEWIDAHRRNAPHRRLRATDGRYAGRGESEDSYSLYYFEDGGSSGMDDSPRSPRVYEAGPHYDWIDLSSQMALSFNCLAAIHGALGDAERAQRWAGRARELGELINAELWCERTRFYHDRMIPTNFLGHKTVAGFWPMLAGICPPERVAALVAHLRDPATFNRPTPVPSLSADDPNYSREGVYWLGGVWAPTNYMVVRGLAGAGQGDLAHDIAVRYVGALGRAFAAVEPHTLWESYCPETDRPGLTAYSRQQVKPDFVGWTGIGPIAMLIENIIGLDVDAAAGRVTWEVRLTEEHGMRRLPVGGGRTADFRCAARGDAGAPARVEIKSEAPLDLHLSSGARRQTVRVEANRTVVVTV